MFFFKQNLNFDQTRDRFFINLSSSSAIGQFRFFQPTAEEHFTNCHSIELLYNPTTQPIAHQASRYLYTFTARGGFFVGIPNPTKKIPIPGIQDFSGFWLRDFSGEKNPNPRDLGSQKIPSESHLCNRIVTLAKSVLQDSIQNLCREISGYPVKQIFAKYALNNVKKFFHCL